LRPTATRDASQGLAEAPQDLGFLDDLGDPETTRLGDFAERRQARHDDDREPRIGRSDLSQDGNTTHRRQPNVEHDRVRALAREIGQAVFPRIPDRRLVAVLPERLRENLSFIVSSPDPEWPPLSSQGPR